MGFASLTPGACTVSGITVTYVSGSGCIIQAYQNGGSGYIAAPQLTLTFGVQTITFAALPNRHYGDAPFSVSATASSGLPVSFSSLTPTVCSVSGSTVTILDLGVCTIEADQAGTAAFFQATPVTQSFTIATASQTIIFFPLGRQLWGTVIQLIATSTSGLPVSFTASPATACTLSGTVLTISNPVTSLSCRLLASQAGGYGYLATSLRNPITTLVSSGTAQTITFGTIANQAFPSTPLALSATSDSGLAVTIGSLSPQVCAVSGTTATGFTVSPVKAGTCSLEAYQVGAAPYVAAPAVVQSFTYAAAVASVPVITAAATSAPNANGWYNVNVTVHFTCSDTGSTIPAGACPADQILDGQGTTISSVALTVTDADGQTSPPSNVVTVQIDTTPPTITAALIPATPNGANGYYNTYATVHFTCSDTLSGIPASSCPANQILTDGVGVTSTALTVTDIAGNISAPSNTVSANIYTVQPVLSLIPGTYATPQTVAMSVPKPGTNGIYYTVNGGPWIHYTAPSPYPPPRRCKLSPRL